MYRKSASILALIDVKPGNFIIFQRNIVYLPSHLTLSEYMKTRIFLTGLLMATLANAQIVYHDAAAFPLLGKATEATVTRYERLPESLQDVSRKPLWELGRNSAGLAVRFRSNSTCIAAKWEVRNNAGMNHMTPTGIKGLDLYCLQDGKWIFAGSTVRKAR